MFEYVCDTWDKCLFHVLWNRRQIVDNKVNQINHLSSAPCFFSKFLSFFHIIRDQEVVENGPGLDLIWTTVVCVFMLEHYNTASLPVLLFMNIPSIETHLPQIQTENTDFIKLVDLGVWAVLGVVDLRVHPDSFVVGVVNLLWFPLSLQRQKEGVWQKILSSMQNMSWFYSY